MVFIRLDSRRAFSLIEAAIVLALVGLVIGGIWVAASEVNQSRKVSRALEQLAYLIPKLQTKFRDVDTTSPYALNDTVSSGHIPKTGWGAYLPPDMIGNDSNPTNPWGRSVQIIINLGLVGIEYDLPDAKSCVALAPRIAKIRSAQDPSWQVFTSNGLDVSTTALALTNCAIEYSTDNHILINFTFPL